jgi:hypothetical protein
MDFMFEDEVDEVGSDVEAYCPKCKADTTHVVISKYEDEIRRVQCNPCGDVHSFRKPRGEVEDDIPEPIAAKKRAMLKKLNWEEFFAKHGEKHGKPYEFREHYSENVIVTHPKFGRGFVSEVMSDSKVEITFKDARRVLVHNRKDMPGLPLAAEGDGIPSKGPKAKAVKNKAAKDERLAAKASAPVSTPAKTAPAAPTAAKSTDDTKNDIKTGAKNDIKTGARTSPAKAADRAASPDLAEKSGKSAIKAGRMAPPPAKPGKPPAKAAVSVKSDPASAKSKLDKSSKGKPGGKAAVAKSGSAKKSPAGSHSSPKKKTAKKRR